ncbi:MAG: hypothetical protein Q8N71_05760 [candidate division Zixibacteria bacterium]|nr:hypothetical protein [candidate division Zixibacteria bacterium]
MRIFRLSGIGYIILFCIALNIDAFGQSVNSPCQIYGIVNYKGHPVPDGCVVKASILGYEYASTKVKEGKYSLSIPADDPSTPNKEGWVDGEYIALQVINYSGVTLFEAPPDNPRVDVNLNTMGVLNLTTWGKIKALFK